MEARFQSDTILHRYNPPLSSHKVLCHPVCSNLPHPDTCLQYSPTDRVPTTLVRIKDSKLRVDMIPKLLSLMGPHAVIMTCGAISGETINNSVIMISGSVSKWKTLKFYFAGDLVNQIG